MAEFCLKCFNKINDSNYSKFDVIEDWGICEECGEHTEVVIDLRGFGLLNFFLWMCNRAYRKWQMFYDDYLWEICKKLRFRYSREQKQAMARKIPMTEELFWECVGISYKRMDNLELRYLLKTFPEYMRKFCQDYERERLENPGLRAKEEEEWAELRASLVADFGEEYVKEHFTD